jgi:hypothetical protein
MYGIGQNGLGFLCNYCNINNMGSRAMNMDAQMQQDSGDGFFPEPSNIAARIDARARAADSERSEKTILQWVSYFPRTCVKTMIRMGWNKTT